MKRVVLITGASSGIGLALSKVFLESEGEITVVAVCRNRSNLKDLRPQFSERLIIVEADIASEAGRSHLCGTINSIDKIDYIVHCAAVVTPLGQLKNVDYQEWKICQQTNVDAPVFLTLQLLTKLSYSKVLFITSDETLQPVYGAASYCVSKMALHMAYACLKNEIPVEKASLGLLAPGNVDTPMQQRIRMTDPKELPIATAMAAAYAQHQFLTPQIAASFISKILITLSNEEFSSKCWNIYADFK
jgi:benzil reductase ((S)-benzoin forming)